MITRSALVVLHDFTSAERVLNVGRVFVSFENPYNLVDVPHMKTLINCYAGSDAVIRALMEKLTGKSRFKGKSPVDPFCGKWETKR